MKSSFMVIFSHYFLIHNEPRSHYRLIYTISLPQLHQLNKAKGFFLRSRLTDLPLICTLAPRSPVRSRRRASSEKYTDQSCIVAGEQSAVWEAGERTE